MNKISIIPRRNIRQTSLTLLGYSIILGGYIYFDYTRYSQLDFSLIGLFLIGIIFFCISFFLAYNRRVDIRDKVIRGAFREWPDRLLMRLKDEYTKRDELIIKQLKRVEFRTVMNENTREIPILILETNQDFYLDMRGFSEKQKDIIHQTLKNINNVL